MPFPFQSKMLTLWPWYIFFFLSDPLPVYERLNVLFRTKMLQIFVISTQFMPSCRPGDEFHFISHPANWKPELLQRRRFSTLFWFWFCGFCECLLNTGWNDTGLFKSQGINHEYIVFGWTATALASRICTDVTDWLSDEVSGPLIVVWLSETFRSQWKSF